MPSYFVVQEPNREDSLFTFSDEHLSIGRDSNCNLCLKHITVSREHAVFFRKEHRIENQALQEPLLVNQDNVQNAVLSSRDTIQIGCYLLIYFDGSQSISETEWDSGFLSDLDAYTQQKTPREGATLHMNPENLQNVQRSIIMLKKAEVISLADEQHSWKPRNGTLKFGKGETVPVRGWFLSGCVATIQFSGTHHTLKKSSSFASVTINGKDATAEGSILNDGDVFQIGKSLFKYQIKE